MSFLEQFKQSLDVIKDAEDLAKIQTLVQDNLFKECPYNNKLINDGLSEEEVNITNITPDNYVDVFTKIGSRKSYFENQESLIKLYIQKYDLILELIGAAMSHLIVGKTVDDRKVNQKLQLIDIYMIKNEIESLLSQVQGRIFKLKTDWDTTSRIISFWEYEFKTCGPRYVKDRSDEF